MDSEEEYSLSQQLVDKHAQNSSYDTFFGMWKSTYFGTLDLKKSLTHVSTDTPSPVTVIFISFTAVGTLTGFPASLLLNVSVSRGLHEATVYTVTGHDLITAAISLASPTRCLLNLILPRYDVIRHSDPSIK